MRMLSDFVGLHAIDGIGDTTVPKRHDWQHESERRFLVRIDGIGYAFDESSPDEYRSSLAEITRIEWWPRDASATTFPPVVCTFMMQPAKARLSPENDQILVAISERTGLVMLEVGTHDFDDYYPTFIARWIPEGYEPDWLKPVLDAVRD